MRDLTMNDGSWSAAPRPGQRRVAQDGSHLRVLLVVAAVLLAFALGLEDRFLSWVMGTAPNGISIADERHLEEVSYVLELDHARRAERAGLSR